MYGDDALKLVMEARRSQQTGTLSKYSDTLVRTVCLETRQLGDSIAQATSSSTPEELRENMGLVCNLTVQHLSARRNKRCLMAYHHHRVDMLKDMFWGAGGALAHLLNSSAESSNASNSTGTGLNPTDTNIRSKLSPQEVDFLRSYSDLVLTYKSDFLDVLDLTSSISSPPGELYTDVKVIKDCGSVWTEMGVIEFRIGQRYMCRRSDVERLIVQGFLEEV